MNNLIKILTVLFFSVSLYAETVSVMTFNVENLFDNRNDAYKTDETYLEFSKKQTSLHIKNCEKISTKRWRDDCLYIDWTDEVIEHKLSSIASVILSYGSNGPDIIGLQEVENKRILKQLFKKLDGAGYEHYVLLEGSDNRGIDTAFISKYKIIESKLHKIEFSGATKKQIGDTREIHESVFLINDKKMTVFNVHFPAPYNPVFMRKAAFSTLEKLASTTKGAVLALGDFNVTQTEDDKEETFKNANKAWYVSHRDQCSDCNGTSYWFTGKSWSFLDVIMVRKGRDTNFVNDGVSVVNHPLQTRKDGTPIRYDAKNLIGVSDHFPVVGIIELN